MVENGHKTYRKGRKHEKQPTRDSKKAYDKTELSLPITVSPTHQVDLSLNAITSNQHKIHNKSNVRP